MKAVITYFLFIAFTLGLNAQNIPNGSFEQWGSALTPAGWGTYGSAVPQIAGLGRLATQDSSVGNHTRGKSSLKLLVDSVTVPGAGLTNLSGFAGLGGSSYIPRTGIVFGVVPYTKRPDTLFVDYKYIAALGTFDTALVTMQLTHYDTLRHIRSTLLGFTAGLDTTSSWVTRAIDLQPLYDPMLTTYPDTLQLIIYASYRSLNRGTTLWLDTIHFDASVNIVTSEAALYQTSGINIYPNPSAQELSIHIDASDMNSELAITNLEGKLIYAASIASQITTIPTAAFASGSYWVSVISPDGITRSRGQVLILH